MTRRRLLVVIVLALTALLVLVLVLPPWPDGPAGRVVVSAGGHGLHVTDVPALGCWLVAVAACARLWRE